MPTHTETRAALARMERARAETARHLAIIERQIAARAERMVVTVRAKARQFGRGKSTWTPPDERLYRENLAMLRFARRAEIEALTRKLARQSAAIDALRRRQGVNDPPQIGPAGVPVDRSAVRWRPGTSRRGQSRTERKAVDDAQGGQS